MDDYIKILEETVEQLQEKLAVAEGQIKHRKLQWTNGWHPLYSEKMKYIHMQKALTSYNLNFAYVTISTNDVIPPNPDSLLTVEYHKWNNHNPSKINITLEKFGGTFEQLQDAIKDDVEHLLTDSCQTRIKQFQTVV